MTTQLKELTFVLAPDEKEVITRLAALNHWAPPQVVRTGGMIYEPLTEGKWRYEPLIDDSTLPSGARDRLNIIYTSCSPAGVIIAHEIEEKKDWVKILRPVYIGLGILTLIAFGIALLIYILPILLVCGVIIFGVGVDPAVIVVTQGREDQNGNWVEGEWVEIYRWYS